jgi:hypothetical protein
MKALVAAFVAVVVLAFSASALADPASPTENGCHGYWTTQAKSEDNRGVQGEAIGGKGNSDGDPSNGQAHSTAGRGQTLQAFLGATCGVGSQAP